MAAEAERVAQVTAEAEAAARLQEEQKVAAAKAAAEEKEQAREKKRAEEQRVEHVPDLQVQLGRGANGANPVPLGSGACSHGANSSGYVGGQVCYVFVQA